MTIYVNIELTVSYCFSFQFDVHVNHMTKSSNMWVLKDTFFSFSHTGHFPLMSSGLGAQALGLMSKCWWKWMLYRCFYLIVLKNMIKITYILKYWQILDTFKSGSKMLCSCLLMSPAVFGSVTGVLWAPHWTSSQHVFSLLLKSTITQRR